MEKITSSQLVLQANLNSHLHKAYENSTPSNLCCSQLKSRFCWSCHMDGSLTCPHPKEQHRQAYLCVSEVDKVSTAPIKLVIV